MRLGRRTVAWLAIPLALLLSGAVAVAVAPIRSTSNVTAYDVLGRRLTADPTLRRGEHVRLVVTGFAAYAAVDIHLQPSGSAVTAHANKRGVLSYAFVVLFGLGNGQYVLAFVGAPPSGRSPPASGGPPAGPRDVQNVIATVPEIGLFRFRIADPGGGGTPAPPGDPHRGLAFTGSDLAGLVLAAIVALLGGALAITVGKGRQRESRDRPAG